MTFFIILSFFPFLIFLLTLTAYTPLNRAELAANLISILPESTQLLVRGIFDELIHEGNTTLLSIGMIAAIWSASNGMMAIIRTLNKAYDEEEHRSYVKVRLISVLYTFGFTIAVWLAFILLVFGHLLGQWAFRTFALSADFEQWWVTLKYVLSLGILFIIFTLLYYSAPSRRMTVRGAIPGAIFATFGWAATSLLFSLYVHYFSSYAKTYGSLGGIIVLLLWLYLSSIILLLGGEINAALVFTQEGKKKPKCKTYGFRFPFLGSTKN